jgi:hypothetical protein
MREAGEVGQDLCARIPRVFIDRRIEPAPEFDLIIPQVGRRQIILGSKGPLEAGFVHTRFVYDGVHPHCPDALMVEQVPRAPADAVGCARQLCLWFPPLSF